MDEQISQKTPVLAVFKRLNKKSPYQFHVSKSSLEDCFKVKTILLRHAKEDNVYLDVIVQSFNSRDEVPALLPENQVKEEKVLLN